MAMLLSLQREPSHHLIAFVKLIPQCQLNPDINNLPITIGGRMDQSVGARLNNEANTGKWL